VTLRAAGRAAGATPHRRPRFAHIFPLGSAAELGGASTAGLWPVSVPPAALMPLPPPSSAPARSATTPGSPTPPRGFFLPLPRSKGAGRAARHHYHRRRVHRVAVKARHGQGLDPETHAHSCAGRTWLPASSNRATIRGCGRPSVAVGGFCGWKGRGPSAVDSTPPGSAPKYPDPGQQGNDLSESQGDRIWSGAGFFPRGFPNPPTTCLSFSLWRDLSVWRIWGGYFSGWRSGWGGVY